MIRLTDHKTRSTELMHAIDIEHRISLSQKVYIPDKVLLQSVIITYTGLDLLGEEGEGEEKEEGGWRERGSEWVVRREWWWE